MVVTSESQTDRYKLYSYISTRWHKSFEQQRERARHEMQIQTKQTNKKSILAEGCYVQFPPRSCSLAELWY